MKRKGINAVVILLVLLITGLWAVAIQFRDALFLKIDANTEFDNKSKIEDYINDSMNSSNIYDKNNNANGLPIISEKPNNPSGTEDIVINKIYDFSEFEEFQAQVLKVWKAYPNKITKTIGAASVNKVGLGPLNISASIPYELTTISNEYGQFNAKFFSPKTRIPDVNLYTQDITNTIYCGGSRVETTQFWKKETFSKDRFLQIYKQSPADFFIDFNGKINEDFAIKNFYFDKYKSSYEFDFTPTLETINKTKDYFIAMFRNDVADIVETAMDIPTVHFTIDKNLKITNVTTTFNITKIELQFHNLPVFGDLHFTTNNGKITVQQNLKYYTDFIKVERI